MSPGAHMLKFSGVSSGGGRGSARSSILLENDKLFQSHYASIYTPTVCAIEIHSFS